MRLTQRESAAIVEVIERFNEGDLLELSLFGSRVDDSKKGGDIDLLICLADHTRRAAWLRKKPGMLAAIKEKLGDQRIDIVITSSDMVGKDPFLANIARTAVSLQKRS